MKAKPQILIVEDERITAEDIQLTLRNLGYAVSSIVSSGRKAIKKIEENKPDLILMDIKLKGDIDGVEAAEQIRARFDIPIIYITALVEDEALQRAKITEPFGYIHKPIEERELYTTIEIALYRDKMERKLKESEEQYKDLVEKAGIAVSTDDKEGRIKYFNKKFVELFGYSVEEMKKQSIQTLVRPEDVERVMRYHKGRIQGKKEPPRYEFQGMKKDGSIIYLEVDVVRLEKEGNIIGTRSYIWDITERKQAEKERKKLQDQLIQAEKMAGIGTLAGGIAHEFNNLFQIIRGHTEHAQKTRKPKDIEEASNLVIHNIDRGAKIIKDLLAFSREKASGKSLSDITEPIESVLSLTEEQLKKHNIKVVRKYKKTPTVEINKAEMQQVFLNMVTNARDAMLPKRGTLEIKVSQVDKNVEVSIIDTGKGIDKEKVGKLFEPFYTTKGTDGGQSELLSTGLGLSVSYGIVKRHGGTIEVESEEGKGSAFTIKLPVKEEKVEERIPNEDRRNKNRKSPSKNILVVDDEEEICKMLTKWLSLEGHRVISALTGKKAIYLAKKKNFYAVFLDIIMPGIPGIEALKKIKKISPETKVVIMTGKLMNKDLLNELRQKGASGFLQKPFKIEDIMRTIKE